MSEPASSVLTIEVKVSQDVHPELFSALASVADPRRRAERLRTLATLACARSQLPVADTIKSSVGSSDIASESKRALKLIPDGDANSLGTLFADN